MKQNINPGVFIAIVVAVVAIATAVCFSVFRAPAAAVAAPEAGAQAVPGKGASAAMKSPHGGPSESQAAQIQEWKKAHPEAYTRY
jgi:hypothetical protein